MRTVILMLSIISISIGGIILMMGNDEGFVGIFSGLTGMVYLDK